MTFFDPAPEVSWLHCARREGRVLPGGENGGTVGDIARMLEKIELQNLQHSLPQVPKSSLAALNLLLRLIRMKPQAVDALQIPDLRCGLEALAGWEDDPYLRAVLTGMLPPERTHPDGHHPTARVDEGLQLELPLEPD